MRPHSFAKSHSCGTPIEGFALVQERLINKDIGPRTVDCQIGTVVSQPPP
jgi:hypothetical protein